MNFENVIPMRRPIRLTGDLERDWEILESSLPPGYTTRHQEPKPNDDLRGWLLFDEEDKLWRKPRDAWDLKARITAIYRPTVSP